MTVPPKQTMQSKKWHVSQAVVKQVGHSTFCRKYYIINEEELIYSNDVRKKLEVVLKYYGIMSDFISYERLKKLNFLAVIFVSLTRSFTRVPFFHPPSP